MQKALHLITLGASLVLAACNQHSTTSDKNIDTVVHHGESMSDSIDKDTAFAGSMHVMMDKMNAVQMTGDFDIDFATMMIPHHEGAVEMSGEELSKGTDDSLKVIAQRIIDGQNSEIATLRDFIKTYKPSGMKHGEGKLYETMANMGMIMPAGVPDKDFVTLMIPHHESAIAMAQAELKYGMSAEMKELARKIITTQTAEIKWFKNWLATHK